MKKHPCLRTCVVALLTVTLSVACVPSALALAEGDAASSSSASAASASSAATYEKSEVVYATLAASGAPKAVYVVNRFDVEVPGTVVDNGDYTSVQNLTNETELARIGDAHHVRGRSGHAVLPGRRRKRRIARGTCRCPTNWTVRRWRPTSWPALRATWPSM